MGLRIVGLLSLTSTLSMVTDTMLTPLMGVVLETLATLKACAKEAKIG